MTTPEPTPAEELRDLARYVLRVPIPEDASLTVLVGAIADEVLTGRAMQRLATWHPIDEAPLDGRWVLLATDPGAPPDVAHAEHEEAGETVWVRADGSEVSEPKHYALLPEYPGTAETGPERAWVTRALGGPHVAAEDEIAYLEGRGPDPFTTSVEDERIVDALMAKRTASLATRRSATPSELDDLKRRLAASERTVHRLIHDDEIPGDRVCDHELELVNLRQACTMDGIDVAAVLQRFHERLAAPDEGETEETPR